MNKILEVNNISKNYHTINGEIEAIKDISFNVDSGEIIGIVGSSGCGKSTLLSILAGLDNDYIGDYKFYNNNVGLMLQSDALLPWLNVYDNCMLGLKIGKKDINKYNDIVSKLISEYGLDSFKYKYPKDLSGGMRQRVALIRTLALNPEVLLLDEPFSALDYQTRLIISNDIYNIAKNNNKTIILVTHDLAEAISMCDRIIVLSKRPCSIKNIYNINLDNKDTPINNRKSNNFSYYYDLLWKELDVIV